MTKELAMLEKSPPTGVSCSAKSEDNLGVLEATLLGPDDSPYAGGTFNLDIRIPDRYPFEPPEGTCNLLQFQKILQSTQNLHYVHSVIHHQDLPS